MMSASFPPAARFGSSGAILYAGAIFLGAFLLFAIQPIAGKHLLPFFGGSSSVWATSLVFFTAMLFLGYLYVYLLTACEEKVQPVIHACVVFAGVAAMLLSLLYWHSIYVPLDWTVGSEAPPAWNVLLALLLSIGAPYFLLSTTGPLLQYWYGASGTAEVYKLYALSNAGSLGALLCYPFFIEPFVSLRDQSSIWAALFFAYAFLVALVALMFFSRSRAQHHATDADANGEPPVSLRAALLWIAYAALPSFMLVATTTQITQVVAPVPLLWIAPLSLYLLTFIFAFAGRASSIYLPPLLLAAAGFAYWFTPGTRETIVWQGLSYLALLFFCGLCCHGRLYEFRPQVRRLPLFYLLLSFGGMLGCLTASIVAPLVFSDFWEFPFGIALSAGFAMLLLAPAFFPRILGEREVQAARILSLLVFAYLFTRVIFADPVISTLTSRNFYGAVKVSFTGDMVTLMHGTTLHGMQFTAKDQESLPTTYYAPGSGVARAVSLERGVAGARALQVGVVGLGTGTMAAYCRPGDRFVFYEIDPRIRSIATEYFTYVPRCKGAEVRLGDGRMLLESERRAGDFGKYDVLVVDAFSDDTIPVHLLTFEALRLYIAHLASPQSILAVHTSNRYLDLASLALRQAAELRMNAMVVEDGNDQSPGASPSQWVLITGDPAIFRSRVFAGVDSWLPATNTAPIWTDDYSSLFPLVHLPSPL